MIWALLAAFPTKKPPLVQAVVLGLCAGLFVATGAEASNRDPLFERMAFLVLVVGVITGGLFYAGLTYQGRHPSTTAAPAPIWLYAIYVAVWLGGLLATLLALFGAGGFKVAVLAIVPLVLIAPTAMQGLSRLLVHTQAYARASIRR